MSGLLSFGQASLFKVPAFRRYFNMHPLESIPITPTGKPPTPYKGNMKVRAPLTQAELNNAFQESRKQSLLEKAKKSMMDATKEIRTAGGTMVGKATEKFDARREKAEKASRKEYEERRQEEIRAEAEERRRIRRQEAKEAKEAKAKKRARYEE
jgi:hypothetical protein